MHRSKITLIKHAHKTNKDTFDNSLTFEDLILCGLLLKLGINLSDLIVAIDTLEDTLWRLS